MSVYANFYDTTTQTSPVGTTSIPVVFNKEGIVKNIKINKSRDKIKIKKSGDYSINISGTASIINSTADPVYAGLIPQLSRNGSCSNIENGIVTREVKSNSQIVSFTIISITFTVKLYKNDIISVVFEASNSANAALNSIIIENPLDSSKTLNSVSVSINLTKL